MNTGVNWYVLFPNHTQGLYLHSLLRAAGINCTIVPTPRRLSTSCGISLLINEDDLDNIKNIIAKEKVDILEINSLKQDINPNRDRYC